MDKAKCNKCKYYKKGCFPNSGYCTCKDSERYHKNNGHWIGCNTSICEHFKK